MAPCLPQAGSPAKMAETADIQLKIGQICAARFFLRSGEALRVTSLAAAPPAATAAATAATCLIGENIRTQSMAGLEGVSRGRVGGWVVFS